MRCSRIGRYPIASAGVPAAFSPIANLQCNAATQVKPCRNGEIPFDARLTKCIYLPTLAAADESSVKDSIAVALQKLKHVIDEVLAK